MARVMFTAIVADIKGKLSGSVFQGGRTGTIIRNNSYGGGRKTDRWAQRRATLGYLSAYFRDLTSLQKNAWTAFGGGVTSFGPFGGTHNLTGQQAFIKCNANRLLVGLTILDSPGVPPGVIPNPAITITFPGFSRAFLGWTYNNPDFYVVVQAKRQYKGTEISSPGSFKQIVYKNLDGPLLVEITSDWVANYGAVFNGVSALYRYKFVHEFTGISSGWNHGVAVYL